MSLNDTESPQNPLKMSSKKMSSNDNSNNSVIAERKLKHVEVCLDFPVEYTSRTTGFEAYDLPYHSLPNSDMRDVDTTCFFLGKALQAPVFIGAMTGGSELSATINKNLAIAAEAVGVGLMLGSQRVMLANESAVPSFQIRPYAPKTLIIGNLGVAQLNKGYDEKDVIRAIELIGADGLAFHSNPLQEALQNNGDLDFRALTKKLAQIIKNVPYPLMLKEVGHGLSQQVVALVKDLGFAALDVAGAGGTSWAKVEDYVYYGEVQNHDLVEWGIPTAKALVGAHAIVPHTPLIASGGIRSGLEAAKALALGASAVAIARPLLKPATESPEAVIYYLRNFIWQLKVAMHCSACRSIRELQSSPIELR